jgi:hypothetical protein
MKPVQTLVLCLAAAGMAAGAEEESTIQKSFTIPAENAPRIEVDNVFGAIRVTGHAGREVRVTVRRRAEAGSAEELAAAQRDVKLDMTQKGGVVRLYVDGPFRCNCNCGCRTGHLGYHVHYDFEIQAPKQSSMSLHTVNNGEIDVRGLEGDYDISNVNGRIDVEDAAGSGRVHTVNGGIRGTFVRNPRADSSFKTINGPVELYFQPGLSADLRMKTFNGGIYTDFELTPLPSGPVAAVTRQGKRSYKASKFAGMRAGGGGPEIKLDGFNGDIRILERK